MKFALSWLKEYFDTNASLAEITTKLTDIGLEVEQVIDQTQALAPFTVAYIESAEQHPNADKLRVCMVQTGTDTRQIVCGAANARAGIKVVLASEGVTIPANGMVIKKTKIRSVESNGMLCSAEELGLDMDSSGIIELPNDAVVGESAVKALGLGDPVIDIAITPNRADCLGVYGIARDLAAAGLGTLKPLSSVSVTGNALSPISVSIDAGVGCSLFIGCTIKGVKNGPSPEWLQQRLRAIGLRPISTLVDITNFMTIAYNRPLHVFDAKKLKGNIRVTHAKAGEKFAALNDKEYILDSNMVAVSDDSGTLGLGGIIGGTSSAVDENTTDVFLECAIFDPTRIAQTGRKLSINTDARYRFERGVDYHFNEQGAAIAVQMIKDLCGGEASQLVITKNGDVPKPKQISFNPARAQQLAGIKVDAAESNKILTALGFTVSANNVTVPSFRPDIESEADLVEEIARIKGYHLIPSTPLPYHPRESRDPDSRPHQLKVGGNDKKHRAHIAGRVWAGRGLTEAVTFSFVSKKEAELFGHTNADLALLNPISADLAVMRPSLLPNLISAARRNAGRGLADLALFEIGGQFIDVTPQGQKTVACAIRSNQSSPRNTFTPVRSVDVFDAKADSFALLESAGMNSASLKIDREVPSYYHPARAGRITLGEKIVLGYFGELHPGILQKLDVDFPIVGCEIFLDNIPTPKSKGKAKPAFTASAFQAVQRDFAFLADAKIQASDVVLALQAIDKNLITNVSVFDVYAGKGIEAGKKSIAIAITLQAQDRTLTDEEISMISQKLIKAAEEKGLVLRQ